MSIDKSQMKAYAGGLSGGIGVLAGATLVEQVTVIVAWLVSLVDAGAPPQVAGAIAGIVVVVGGFVVGRLITYYSPPNQPVIEAEATKTQELKG